MRAPAIHPASTKAQYAAFARAVNLRPGDVPGFTSHPRHREPGIGEGAFARHCHITLPSSRSLAKFSSSSFEAGPARYREHAGSEIEIGASPSAARAEVAAVERIFSNTRTRECVAAQFRREFTRSETPTPTHRGLRVQLRNTEVQIKPVATPTPEGAEDSGGLAFGVRSLLEVSGHGRHAVVQFALVGVARYFIFGRAMVTFSTWATDTQFPPELESRLVSLLAGRASAARREYPAVRS